MNIDEFDYDLPSELIAQYPTERRVASKLLRVRADGTLIDRQFVDIQKTLQAGDLLVLNNTRVVPARVFGHKDSGGKFELVLERPLGQHRLLAQIKASRAPKLGQRLYPNRDQNSVLQVCGRQGVFFELELASDSTLFDWLERVGELPLPPYINRRAEQNDQQRYQTVFAEKPGAVAAPTAGLHFDRDLLAQIEANGVNIAQITLHVGAGTYQPVKVANILDHKMHHEYLEVSENACAAINQCRASGGRVIAVGTTVMRALESAAKESPADQLKPFYGDTVIFIYPGFEFKLVDMLQTNFHLPKSTLMMLVSAFAGTELIKTAYQHAIQQQYRFFSYGDAMLLERGG